MSKGRSGESLGPVVRATGRSELSAEELNAITGAVIEAAVGIHTRLGPGLLESVYEIILARDLARRGYRVERQKPVSFEFEGLAFDNAFRVDLIVQSAVIVEVKSVAVLPPVYEKQVLTYLRLLDLRVGLLLNFAVPLLKQGIRRIVNGF
ncbi:MAG: GxxExxY protein [Gemmatimonadota bacterium]|jgi:GxxExxY protein